MKIRKLEELDYYAQLEWDNLRTEVKYLNKLIYGYPKRMQAVISNHGESTKY